MVLPEYPQEDAAYLAGLTNEDMINGGHREHFIAALWALVTLVHFSKEAGDEILALAEQVAEDAASAAAGSGTEASVSQIRGGGAAQYLSIRRVYGANEPVSLTREINTAWDMSAGINFDLVLDGDVTQMSNPTNQVAGKSGVLRLKQDATGGRTIGSWGSHFKWVGGVPYFPTAAERAALISYLVWAPGLVYLTYGGEA